jgi:hypothetical protein
MDSISEDVKEISADVEKHSGWLKQGLEELADRGGWLKEDQKKIQRLDSRIYEHESRLNIPTPQYSDAEEGKPKDGDDDGDASGNEANNSDRDVAHEDTIAPEGLHAISSAPVGDVQRDFASSMPPIKGAAASIRNTEDLQIASTPPKSQFSAPKGGEAPPIKQ